MAKIIQADNYKANFGYCLRSSSIFYIPPKPIKTSIVLSNYWKFKNDIDVFLLISFRDMSGKLLMRQDYNFEEKNVLEIIPPKELVGSCEIEAFSSKDLRIPYSAIMAVYECKSSISMVHSYSRIYSNLEIEDKKTISKGHEGCWTLKDSDLVETFAVIHNGVTSLKNQVIKFIFKNHKNEEKIIKYDFPSLAPYETKLIKPKEFFKNITEFLENKEGSCTFHFELSNSFTRLLVGWQTLDSTQLQVTHSNFDYSTHETDFVESDYKFAHMQVPSLDNKKLLAIVYPDRSPGIYEVESESRKKFTIPQSLYTFKSESEDLKFSRKDGKLPSRIVTAIKVLSNDIQTLSCECSLGVIHKLRPPKRFHWGL